MKIIIVGVGEVGFYLAKLLSQEGHDIVVMDQSEEPLARIREILDVMTIRGNGSQVSDLQEAGAHDADMLIAVTSIDEVNFVACFLAHRLGTRKTILRVDEHERFFGHGSLKPEDVGIDHVISPDNLAAAEIVRLIRRSAATDVLEFADGRIQILGLKLDKESPMINRKLKELTKDSQA